MRPTTRCGGSRYCDTFAPPLNDEPRYSKSCTRRLATSLPRVACECSEIIDATNWLERFKTQRHYARRSSARFREMASGSDVLPKGPPAQSSQPADLGSIRPRIKGGWKFSG